MGKSTVNWDSQETWQRVVAAIIATGVKVCCDQVLLDYLLSPLTAQQIDYKQVALHFGTTYGTPAPSVPMAVY